MMIFKSYKDFETDFIKKNRILLKLYVLNTLVFLCLVVFLALRKERFIFTNNNPLSNKMLKTSFCYEAFKNVTSLKPSEYFLTEEIFRLVSEAPFSLGKFSILYLSDFNPLTCKIIVKTDLGLKSFYIKLKESESFPLKYKLFELLEAEIEKEAL